MDRREFVQRLPVMTSGGVLAGVTLLSLEGCGGISYLVPETRPGALIVDKGLLGDRAEALVAGPGMERPVYVRRAPSGELVALLAACTHQGCQPEPIGDRLVCPCHGSEFDLEGAVVQGPAERPLVRFRVTDEGDSWVVWLDSAGAA